MEKQKMSKRVITIDTMCKIGKEIQLAGRNYTICPINVEDMGILLNSQLFIPTKKQIDEGQVPLSFMGLNITEDDKKEVFYYVANKYLRYEKEPVTEEMIIEHNWTFSDIKKFLFAWIEISE